MNKIIITIVAATAALFAASCSSSAVPVPTVTVTAPAPEQNVITNKQEYIDFVKSNGGVYASVADAQSLVDLGETVCSGYERGLSQDEIVQALSYALTESDMDNEAGAKFGAAIIVGAERYLCGRVGV